MRELIASAPNDADLDTDLIAEGLGGVVATLRAYAETAPGARAVLTTRVLAAISAEAESPSGRLAAPVVTASLLSRMTLGLRPASFRLLLAAATLIVVLGAGVALAASGALPFDLPSLGGPGDAPVDPPAQVIPGREDTDRDEDLDGDQASSDPSEDVDGDEDQDSDEDEDAGEDEDADENKGGGHDEDAEEDSVEDEASDEDEDGNQDSDKTQDEDGSAGDGGPDDDASDGESGDQ